MLPPYTPTRRQLLTGTACTVAAAWGGAPLAAPLDRLSAGSALPLLRLDELAPGDVLHLRVNCLFTSYNELRPVIRGIQERMLTSASQTSRSLYFHILEQHRALGLPHHDPVAGADQLQDTVQDLINSGHNTIYVGDGQVIETTGAGCRVRSWQDIDTARYVVMRARDPAHAALIEQVARAIGGSTQAGAVQRALLPLAARLPPTDQVYLEELCAADCQDDIIDQYDMASASKGFFGKLKHRHHIGSKTPIDSMLYLDRRQEPRLHRDTVCSSYVALVLTLCDRMNGWAAIGETFDEDKMTEAQRTALRDLEVGAGCSTHVRPEWVLPAYLDLGMQVSGRFDTVGQFINIGAAINAAAAPGEPVALARPHVDYLAATEDFVRSLSTAERGAIQMPVLSDPSDFVVTDTARLPHPEAREDATRLYRSLLEQRAHESAP